MPYLQAISKKHMLVVIMFENTELDDLISQRADTLQNIYHKTIAEKFSFEKTPIFFKMYFSFPFANYYSLYH